MKIKEFVNKYAPLLSNVTGTANDFDAVTEEFARDAASLVHNSPEVLIEDIETLVKALGWVAMEVKQRDAFLIVSTYLRVQQKSEEFSLKDASDLFGRTERLFAQPNRNVYGGQYFYMNEAFAIGEDFDYRTTEDDVRYESGNYFLAAETLQRVIDKDLKPIRNKK